MNLLRLKLVVLNVVRNGRRSLFSLLAIMFGVTSLIIFSGFVTAMYEGMRENMIRSQYGHIQIYQSGFNQYGNVEPNKYLIKASNLAAIQKIISNLDQVELTTPRLNFTGLLTNQTGRSLSVVVEGISPDNEALLSSAIKLISGQELFDDDIEGALLGQGLFNALNIKVGDYLTLLTSNSEGGIDARDVRVSGVISTGSRELDDRFLRTNIIHAQDLLYTKDVTRLIVLLKDTHITEQVAELLKLKFKNNNLDLEIRTWSQLANYYHEVVNLFDSMFYFVQIIVVFIVLLSISNTMMMTVMERTSEIGTIRAIGGTRNEVVNLFVSEAILIGVIASVCGALLATALAEFITALGIMMPTPPGSSETYPIRIFVTPQIIISNVLLGIIIAIISSIYPSIKASRMIIVKALRYA